MDRPFALKEKLPSTVPQVAVLVVVVDLSASQISSAISSKSVRFGNATKQGLITGAQHTEQEASSKRRFSHQLQLGDFASKFSTCCDLQKLKPTSLHTIYKGRKMSTNRFLHNLFEHSQMSGTSQRNSGDIPGSLASTTQEDKLSRTELTFRPPPLRIEDPNRPGNLQTKKVNLCTFSACLNFAAF